jgi:predicted PurR-regulated permease PerM
LSADLHPVENVTSRPPAAAPRAREWALRVLVALAVLFAIKHSREILLPIVVAVVFAFMLAPAVRRLRHYGITESIGAALVVIAVLAGIAAVGAAVTGPALAWWERAPSNMRQLSDAVDRLRHSLPFFEFPAGATPQTRPEARPTRQPAAPPPAPPPDPIKERLASEGLTFTRMLLLQVSSFALSAAATVMLLYFLLASERWLIARTVQAIPRRRARALLLSGVRRTQRDISYYFTTQLFINCAVGAAVALTSWWLGLPNPLLWGVLTGVLNFIPYLGPLTAAVVVLLAGILAFDAWGDAVAPTLALIAVHALESNIVSPLVVSRRLELSPLAVFLAVMLWGWLWGVAGALIAVPVLLGVRIASHRVRALRGWAAYLDRGREVPSLRALIRSPKERRMPRARIVRATIRTATRESPREDL